MAYIEKSSQWYIKKEATYDDRAGFNNLDSVGAEVAPTSTEFVEAINPTMDATTELLEREVLKNSLVMAQPLLGKETSSGSMEVEAVSATGVAGAKTINGDLLYESAFGQRIADVTSEVASAFAAGVATVASGAVYTVGQAVKLEDASASTTEYAVIRSISGNDLTLAPTPTADGIDVTITGLLSFKVATPDTAQISLAVQEYMEGNSTQGVYTYGGVVATDASMSFPVANIVKTNFSLAGAGFDVANNANAGQTVANRASQCIDLDPYVAKNMTFTYAGTSYDVEDLEVNVSSDIYDTEALTTDGITNKTATAKSDVGATFMLEYDGTSLFDAYQAGTDGVLFGTVSNATTTAGIFAPKVILTEASKSMDSGIYKESLSARFLTSDTACTAGDEDAITVFFE